MTSPTPLWRLSVALFLMLGFAVAEIATAAVTGLAALRADALHMLAHSVMLAFAWVWTALAAKLGDPNRKWEAAGGIACALMLIGMGAVVGLGLMEHAHAHVHDHGTHGHHDHGAPASLGWVLTAFALVSIALHAFIVWFLYSGRAHLTVLGACLSMGTHVLLMVVMACCGLLMATFHLPGLDTLMAFVIACVMVMTGARLGLRSTKVLLGATS